MTCLPLSRDLPLVTLLAGKTVWRVHHRSHQAIHFDRGNASRFSAPTGEYGVCYLGDSIEVAFLETLIRGSHHRVVPKQELAARHATELSVDRAVNLLKLHSEGLVQLGCSADVPHRAPYGDCQRIALELWTGYRDVDGIEYRSRWNDRLLCVALFDRAADAVSNRAPPVPLDDLRLLRPILRRYDIGVV